MKRTTQGLRDVLFEEIEELRSGKGDAAKSMAVANLAKQIINTAKVELDFVRVIHAQNEAGNPVVLGGLVLGTSGENNVSSAHQSATGRSPSTKKAQPHSTPQSGRPMSQNTRTAARASAIDVSGGSASPVA